MWVLHATAAKVVVDVILVLCYNASLRMSMLSSLALTMTSVFAGIMMVVSSLFEDNLCA